MEKSGQAAADFLRARGADVTATDLKPHDMPGFRLQTEELFDEPWDLIVLSPGRPGRSSRTSSAARARGVNVIGEVELAAPFLRGPVIGITGSNGKTTTTSLVGHILRKAGVPGAGGRQHRDAGDRDDRDVPRGPMERSRAFQLPARNHPRRSARMSASA